MICNFPQMVRAAALWAAQAEDLHAFTIICVSTYGPLYVKLRWIGSRCIYDRELEFDASLERDGPAVVILRLDAVRDQLAEEIRRDNERTRRRRRRRD